MPGSWGESFGQSFGISFGGASSVPVVLDTDTHDGRARWDVTKADRAQQERERLRRASQDELRSIVERAFRKANGEPEPNEVTEPVTAPERREMARLIQADIRTEGLSARLRDIEALILEYQRLIEEERDDEEAAAILLLMN